MEYKAKNHNGHLYSNTVYKNNNLDIFMNQEDNNIKIILFMRNEDEQYVVKYTCNKSEIEKIRNNNICMSLHVQEKIYCNYIKICNRFLIKKFDKNDIIYIGNNKYIPVLSSIAKSIYKKGTPC